MFPEQVTTSVHGVSFRVKAKREQDPTKTVEIAVNVPLTPDLADASVIKDLKPDLFTRNGNPKKDLLTASFEAPAKLWLLEVRAHQDIKRPHKIGSVKVRKVSATKGDSGEWLLGFILGFTAGDPKDYLEFIRFLGSTCTLAFAEQQPSMLEDMDDDAGDPDGGLEADVATDGTVERVRPRKKRGGEATKH